MNSCFLYVSRNVLILNVTNNHDAILRDEARIHTLHLIIKRANDEKNKCRIGVKMRSVLRLQANRIIIPLIIIHNAILISR